MHLPSISSHQIQATLFHHLRQSYRQNTRHHIPLHRVDHHLSRPIIPRQNQVHCRAQILPWSRRLSHQHHLVLFGQPILRSLPVINRPWNLHLRPLTFPRQNQVYCRAQILPWSRRLSRQHHLVLFCQPILRSLPVINRPLTFPRQNQVYCRVSIHPWSRRLPHQHHRVSFCQPNLRSLPVISHHWNQRRHCPRSLPVYH